MIGTSGKLVRSKYNSPLGTLLTVADDEALYLLEFENRLAVNGELEQIERTYGKTDIATNSVLDLLSQQLNDYFIGKSASFQVHTRQYGSELEMAVWNVLKQIPPGQTRSYGDIAKQIGHPDKSREVGQANGANKIAIVIPCHRVIGSDGSLVGYGGGLWRKKWLLDHERKYAWASFEE
jgi:AraC family transcriptional regulator of adaptative response/methylated-DNA-[protein]-cysteine methyltransferase